MGVGRELVRIWLGFASISPCLHYINIFDFQKKYEKQHFFKKNFIFFLPPGLLPFAFSLSPFVAVVTVTI
jgi:hypothetical protein